MSLMLIRSPEKYNQLEIQSDFEFLEQPQDFFFLLLIVIKPGKYALREGFAIGFLDFLGEVVTSYIQSFHRTSFHNVQ